MSWILFVLTALATWRLSRLLSVDYITEPLRVRAEQRSEKLGYLAQCTWCSSQYVGLVVALVSVLVFADVSFWLDGLWLTVLLWQASSGVSGLLVDVEQRLDR